MTSRTRTSLPGVPPGAAAQRDYANGFGTLYTADYRPDSGEVHYRWPGTTWTRSFDSTDAELRLDVPAS